MKTLASMKMIEGNVQGFILSIVGVAVVLAVGLIVLAAVNTSIVSANTKASCGLNSTGGTVDPEYTTCGGAYNATSSIITQMATVPQWIGIIITVALAFIVLGYFYNRM